MPLKRSQVNIQDEGVDQGPASTVNFVGTAVTAVVTDGLSTVTITGGAGGGGTLGQATIDFGATPTVEASVTVTGLASITASSKVAMFIMGTTTVDNDEQAHLQAGALMQLTSGIPVAGSGFTIYARCMAFMATGQFKVQYRWE